MIVRTEEDKDREAVYAVNRAAFGTAAEADLVDALRAQARPIISLVAELGDGSDSDNTRATASAGEIIGHIMFSPVVLSTDPDATVMGLGPMAVAPEHQRKGVGSALVQAGLEECKRAGRSAVVVLGHPEYYPRFGFVPASRFGIGSEYDVPDDVFMALELQPGALGEKTDERRRGGTASYHAAFGSI